MNSKAIHCRLYNEEIQIRSEPDVVLRAPVFTITIDLHNQFIFLGLISQFM